jgi:SagB-type dehydrogenase family enzyme
MGRTMNSWVRMVCLCVVALSVPAMTATCQDVDQPAGEDSTIKTITLPPPQLKGHRSLEEALAARRSVREFTSQTLTDGELSQLLWAAQGITSPKGQRTAPSAAALYPLELYVVLPSGLYKYVPARHELIQQQETDLRPALRSAALGQEAVTRAPAVFVVAADYSRTERRFGPRGERFVHLEAGHAAQNLLLEATALDLGGVSMGAFDDQRVRAVLHLPDTESPLYLLPVGHPASR